MIALLLAILALLTQPTPADFTAAALTRGQPVVSAAFVGLAWPCDAADTYSPSGELVGEECYAGLIFVDGAPSLETGP